MRGDLLRLVTLSAVLFLSACEEVEQHRGQIHLPEGDAAIGQQEFVALGCVGCHTVIGAELPEQAEPGPVRVVLGSQTRRKMSYEQLVTSIVNPSHRISRRYRKDDVTEEGQSLMASYNDVMTVTQLTHLVAFLQQHYVESGRTGYTYPVYDYQGAQEAKDEASSE